MCVCLCVCERERGREIEYKIWAKFTRTNEIMARLLLVHFCLQIFWLLVVDDHHGMAPFVTNYIVSKFEKVGYASVSNIVLVVVTMPWHGKFCIKLYYIKKIISNAVVSNIFDLGV